MTLYDAVGYLASGLVLAAFCMKEIVPLRVVALVSNLAFLVYGIGMDLAPVWLLHALLLPMNGWRLAQALAQGPRPAGPLSRVGAARSSERAHGAERPAASSSIPV